jgi:hypothetical protein
MAQPLRLGTESDTLNRKGLAFLRLASIRLMLRKSAIPLTDCWIKCGEGDEVGVMSTWWSKH